MTSKIRTLSAVLGAALVLTTACADTVIQQPTFGSGCRVGALRAGEEVTAAFQREQCVLDYSIWSGSTVAYATYTVDLQRGKGYHFYAAPAPDTAGDYNGTRIITLYGKDENGQSVPLALSNTDAGGPFAAAEFYFIAPRSGTYNLVVSNYDLADRGGYRLAMEQCPVLGTIETAGIHRFTMPPSACVRRNMTYNGIATQIALIGVKVVPGKSQAVTLNSDAFTPYFEVGGPGFDVFANVYANSDFNFSWGDGTVASVYTREATGAFTLAVGSDFLDPRGPFSVTLDLYDVPLHDAPLSLMDPRPGHRTLGLPRP